MYTDDIAISYNDVTAYCTTYRSIHNVQESKLESLPLSAVPSVYCLNGHTKDSNLRWNISPSCSTFQQINKVLSDRCVIPVQTDRQTHRDVSNKDEQKFSSDKEKHKNF